MNLEAIQIKYSKGELSKSEYIDAMYECHRILFNYSTFITKTNLSSIEIFDNKVIATFRDSSIRFICIPGDKRLVPIDTLNFSNYELEELQMQYKLIKPYDTIIDIGANLGWYSMHIAKQYPQCRVFAFEPIPDTYNFLNKNLKINKIENVYTHLKGLSSEPGTLKMFYDPLLSVNASLQNLTNNDSINTINCEIDTLDNFSEINKIENIHFIKCDIEGAELFALKGATNVLRNSKPIIFCEMLRKWSKKFNYHPNDIINFMANLDYTCYIIIHNKLQIISEINDETTATNFIFLHNINHKQQQIDFAN